MTIQVLASKFNIPLNEPPPSRKSPLENFHETKDQMIGSTISLSAAVTAISHQRHIDFNNQVSTMFENWGKHMQSQAGKMEAWGDQLSSKLSQQAALPLPISDLQRQVVNTGSRITQMETRLASIESTLKVGRNTHQWAGRKMTEFYQLQAEQQALQGELKTLKPQFTELQGKLNPTEAYLAKGSELQSRISSTGARLSEMKLRVETIKSDIQTGFKTHQWAGRKMTEYYQLQAEQKALEAEVKVLEPKYNGLKSKLTTHKATKPPTPLVPAKPQVKTNKMPTAAKLTPRNPGVASLALLGTGLHTYLAIDNFRSGENITGVANSIAAVGNTMLAVPALTGRLASMGKIGATVAIGGAVAGMIFHPSNQ